MNRNKLVLLVITGAFGVGGALLLNHADEQLSRRLSPTTEDSVNSQIPKRIALLSTAAEEVLVALGVENRIVGTTGYSTFLKDNPQVQKIGGVMDINFEMLTRLAPDFIIAQTKDDRLARFTAERGIRFMRIDIEKTSDVLQLARTLGDIVGLPQEGAALADKIEKDLATARRLSFKQEKVPCFVSVDRSAGHMTQILTTGRTTFVNELLDIAGCRNVFGDLDTRYPTISKESLAARAPEVIIELKPISIPDPTLVSRMQADWQLLSGIPAVANSRIYVITHEDALIAGPKMAEVALLLAQALHPAPVVPPVFEPASTPGR